MVDERKSSRQYFEIKGGRVSQEMAEENGTRIIRSVFPKSYSKSAEIVFDRADSLNLLKAVVYKDPQKFVFVHATSKSSSKEYGTAAYDSESGDIKTLLTGDFGRKDSPLALFDLEQSRVYLFTDSDDFRQRNVASRFSLLETRGFTIGDYLFTFADLGLAIGFGICFNGREGGGLICPSDLGERIRNKLIGNTIFDLTRHKWIEKFVTYSVEGRFSFGDKDSLPAASVVER